MYFVILEIDDEFIRRGWQDLFESWRLTALDQPKVIDKLMSRGPGRKDKYSTRRDYSIKVSYTFLFPCISTKLQRALHQDISLLV